jgi:hypothetical protein
VRHLGFDEDFTVSTKSSRTGSPRRFFIGGLAKAKSSMYLVSGRRGPTFGIDLTTF